MTQLDPTIHHGDCRDIIATLPDCSVDSIVTDPPYELGFMGKQWDGSGIAYDPTLWAQCLRVLKPGGHLLAFGGTRTYHRMAVAIEDAGFEIRDSIHWLYGSGFPKSLDVSKAIDKMDAAEEQQARRYRFTEWVRSTGVTAQQIDAATGTRMGHHYTTHLTQPSVMTTEHLEACRHLLGDVPEWVEREAAIRSVESRNFASREVVGKRGVPIGHSFAGPTYGGDSSNQEVDITAPATDAARQWEGWGTALKPAHEPIVVARKLLSGTVAATVLEHGTGALNIDGCRVGSDGGHAGAGAGARVFGDGLNGPRGTPVDGMGRWPANLVLTHAADCAEDCAPSCPITEIDRESGTSKSQQQTGKRSGKSAERYGAFSGQDDVVMGHTDTGGASRFFTVTEWDPTADVVPFRYEAKPSRAERNAGLATLPEQLGGSLAGGDDKRTGKPQLTARQNHHPTVKPLALMRWLVRLVTPPGGTVLEPFAGSGTTMAAAILEDRNVIGCELTADYLPIIEGRIAWARRTRDAIPATLFDQDPQ